MYCNAHAPARLLRVAGPKHYVSSFERLADGSAADRLAAGLTATSVGLGFWRGSGAALWIVLAGLAALICFVIALRRRTLRVGEIDEDDHMFKLRNVADEISREVLALGSESHPQQTVRRNDLALHTQGKLS